jgi:hypothetical protein
MVQTNLTTTAPAPASVTVTRERIGTMNAQERNNYALGKRTGELECDTINDPPTIEFMQSAVQDIIDRNTVEPDHPGNISGPSIAYFYGRLEAINDWLSS